MPWKLDDGLPIYQQLIEELQLRILTGYYQPGQRLPSVRDLAEEAAVNPNTMQRALAELERGELLTTQRTTGRFITEDQVRISRLRLTRAQEYATRFLRQIQALGYDTQDAIFLLQQDKKEEST